jgi:competence protein ComEA
VDQERNDNRADPFRLRERLGELPSQSLSDYAAALSSRLSIFEGSTDRIRAISIAAVVGLVVLIGAGLGLRSCASKSDPASAPLFSTPPASELAASTSTTVESIVVHAAGAVRAPGLYRMAKGSRVADVLEVAGGVADGADLNRVNLAALVSDSERIFIPFIGVPMPGPTSGATGSQSGVGGAMDKSGPVNLNTATEDELDALPGIGPATSAAIVSHREKVGPFTSVDDLLDVRGIGTSKLESLRDLVTTG